MDPTKDKIDDDNSKHCSNTALRRGRGRPRKNQILSTNSGNKKNKIIKLDKSTTEKNEDDEEIILHLPISFKDLNVNKTSQINKQISPNTNIFTINDINSDSATDSCEDNDIIVQDLKDKIKDQEKQIQNLEKEIMEYKNIMIEDTSKVGNNRKVYKMNLNFIDIHSGTQIVREKTDIACWWCGYNFDTVPCFIPDKIYNDTYYVFGCFCSFNCAAAYNLKMDDAFVWDRYSLLKRLYNITDETHEDINIAPPRETFSRLGGPLTYEDYKKNCKKCSKEYRFIMPPMTSIVPLIEEGHVDNTKVNISLAELNKKSNLRRSKPLPNTRTTLFETLGINKA